MENKTGKSQATMAYGKKLDAPINYEFSYSIYSNVEEMVAAKDELTLDEQFKVRNAEKVTAARQKALTAALDAAGIVKPTVENDPQLQLKTVFVALMASKKYTEEQARALASQVTGVDWAE